MLGLILLASTNRITSCHIDAGCRCLVQSIGDMTLSVFDPAARTVFTHEELERFNHGDYNRAVYKPERQAETQLPNLRVGHDARMPTETPRAGG